MPFTKDEKAEFEQLMTAYISLRRPSESLRNQLDISFRINDQSIILYTLRPKWDDPTHTIESEIAKATYVRKNRIWKLYCMRRDLKWHRYPLQPEAPSLLAVLRLIDEDALSVFWG